jgi:Tfp pilus assembly protein PilN
MLRLNLVTEDAKQTIKYQRIFFLLLKTEIILIALLLILGGIIFVAQKMLAANILSSGQETAKLISQSSSDYAIKARQLNDQMAIVTQIENGYNSYSLILSSLTSLIPDSISLSYINIDTDTKTIKIRGLAPSRDNFLELEKNLKNSTWLIDVSVPPNDIFSKNNINFDIDMGFNLTKISLK